MKKNDRFSGRFSFQKLGFTGVEKAKSFADRDLIVASALKTENDKAQKVLEAFERAFEKAKASAEKKENAGEHSGIRYSQKFESYTPNSEVLSLISKVKSDSFHQNEKVLLSSNLSVKLINEIKKITGIDVTGFKVAIEARQINHILKKHGVNGDEDNSMSNDNDIAKLEYVLDDPDYISYGGKTNAYSFAKNGHNHTSNTVLYEKEIGDKSFYVVEAVADTKAKTLYIVTSFIGKKGYKKGTSQLINAQSPNATSEADSVVVPNNSIQKGTEKSNSKNKKVNNSPTAEAKHSRRSSTIYDELIEKRAELRDLQQKMKDMKESDEYQEILNESTRAENIDAFVKKYSDYLKSSGMDKLSKDIEDLNKEVERLSEEFSAASNAEGEEKERADIEKSGKTEGDYFTSLAVKEFGYTPYYYDAGYMTQNGKLLNFSGEKGKHYGSRGQDHRAVFRTGLTERICRNSLKRTVMIMTDLFLMKAAPEDTETK